MCDPTIKSCGTLPTFTCTIPHLKPNLPLQRGGVSSSRVGVRFQSVATPNGAPGARMPLLEFFRKGTCTETPDAPAPLRAPGVGARTGRLPEPPLNPMHASLRATAVQGLQATGHLLFLFGIDDLLLRPLVEDGTIPDGARGPLLFSSAVLSRQALVKLGLAQAGSLTSWLGGVPSVVGLQMMAALLLDKAGVKLGSKPNEYGSVIAGISGLVALNSIERAGARLATPVAASWLAKAAPYLKQSAGGLRHAARLLGGVTLVDMALGGVYWAVGKSLGQGSRREYRLEALATRMLMMGAINGVTGERSTTLSTGSIATMLFGNIMQTGLGFSELTSQSTGDSIEDERKLVVAKIVGDSKKFGRVMEDSLFNLFLNQAGPAFKTHLSQLRYDLKAALTTFRPTLDWKRFGRDVTAYYRTHQKAIKSHYQLLADYTGGRVYGAEWLRTHIKLDGTIIAPKRLQSFLRTRALLRLKQISQRLEPLAHSHGLARRLPTGRWSFVPWSKLTAQQQSVYQQEILPLMQQVSNMRLMARILS